MKKDNCEAISFYNEDGSVRSKEDFIKDIEKIYDRAMEENEKANQLKEKAEEGELELLGNSILEVLLDPDMQINAPQILDTYDFSSRTIFLQDEIEDGLATEIIRKIRFWNAVDKIDGVPEEERQPIKIYINTPGGDIQATFNIISTIKMSKTPIYTITYGCGYSGGFFIGICGHKRYGFANSCYLFHEGVAVDGGDAHKFLQHVNFYKLQLKKIKDLTIENTKISADEYAEHSKDDWFFSPTEALHYGIIDEILEEF